MLNRHQLHPIMKKAIVSTVALLLLLRCTYAALQAQHRHHHNKHHETYRGGELIYQAGAYKDAQRIAQPLLKHHKYDNDDPAAATTITRPVSHHPSPSPDRKILLAKPAHDGLQKTSAEKPLSPVTSGVDDDDYYRYHPHPKHSSSSSSSPQPTTPTKTTCPRLVLSPLTPTNGQ